MKKLLASLLFLLMPLLLTGTSIAQAEEEPLPPSEAFQASASVKDSSTLTITWKVADKYYLYHKKFKFRSDTSGVTLGTPVIPAGHVKQDPYFGQVETHRKSISIDLPYSNKDGAKSLNLTLGSQGCADLGICYPPYEQKLTIALPAIAKKAEALKAVNKLGTNLGLEEEEFLEPDKAFTLTTRKQGNTLIAQWKIADGYYMYKNKFKFRLINAPADITLGKVELPEGEKKHDEYFGDIIVYHHNVTATIPINGNLQGKNFQLELVFQGCADAGLCYPPIFKKVNFGSIAAAGNTQTGKTATTPATNTPENKPPATEQDKLVDLLKVGNTWLIIGLFFLAGLGLSLTPCVFPMIPILAGIIVGQGKNVTTRKAFILSLTYVLAMAVTYTIAGILAGKFGTNLTAMFQNPWILSSFAAIFVILSLSMFGYFDIQMPSVFQSRLTSLSNKQQGGSLVGVAVMGFLSALIVGPCVAAPLAGALIFIGQTGDAVLGGTALFALSIGMGVPLLLIGTSGGKILPRAGAWMDNVKGVFGVLLLAVAIWMLSRILPGQITMLLWAALLIISSVYMRALDPLKEGVSGLGKFAKGLGVLSLIYGIILFIGAMTGHEDPMEPMSHFGKSSNVSGTPAPGNQQHELVFKRIKSLEDLQREVKAASKQGKTVMLDFYADWCVSCKEYEKYVFTDSKVIGALKNSVLLQADVTANDDIDKALMKHYKLIGPPTLLLFDKNGDELKNFRIIGYMDAEKFHTHIQQAFK